MKKQYYSPLTEATSINSLLMALTGPASVLPGPGNAPAAPAPAQVPALGNDSVPVF